MLFAFTISHNRPEPCYVWRWNPITESQTTSGFLPSLHGDHSRVFLRLSLQPLTSLSYQIRRSFQFYYRTIITGRHKNWCQRRLTAKALIAVKVCGRLSGESGQFMGLASDWTPPRDVFKSPSDVPAVAEDFLTVWRSYGTALVALWGEVGVDCEVLLSSDGCWGCGRPRPVLPMSCDMRT